jgi:hypothetical protein
LQLYGAVWAHNNADCSSPRWPRRFPSPRPLPAMPPQSKTQKGARRESTQRSKPPTSP